MNYTTNNLLIAIIIPIYNKLEYTKKGLSKLIKALTIASSAYNYKIIIADDGSTDGSAEWIQENYPDVFILHGDGNLWWSGAINVGVKHAIEKLKAAYVILWNNDIYPGKNYFSKLSDILNKYDRNTIIGSKIYLMEPDTVVWHYGGYFNPVTGTMDMIGRFKQDSDLLNREKIAVDWVTGMGTIIPAEIIKNIGYWDESNFPQYFGDMDFTLRAKKKGYKIFVDPKLKIWNDFNSTGLQHNGKLRFFIKSFSDDRSLYNLKRNFLFYRKHGKNFLCYIALMKKYLRYSIEFILFRYRKYPKINIMKKGKI